MRSFPGNRRMRTARSAGLFTPASVSGLAAWFDAAVSYTDDGSTATWVSKAGNIPTTLTATGANRPTAPAPVALLNNLPAPTFVAASSPRLASTTSALLAVFDGVSPYSVYTVLLPSSIAAFQTVWCAGSTTSANNYVSEFLQNASGAVINRRREAGVSYDLVSTSLCTISAGSIISTIFTGSNQTIHRNGVQGLNTGTTRNCTPMDQFTIGCLRASGFSNYFSGNIAEVIVYSGAHDADTRQSIQSWLGSKYAISV